jgi:hypothetical protein
MALFNPGKEAVARRPIAIARVAKNLQFNRNATSRPPDPGSEVDTAFSLASVAGLDLVSFTLQAAAEHVDTSAGKVFTELLIHVGDAYAILTPWRALWGNGHAPRGLGSLALLVVQRQGESNNFTGPYACWRSTQDGLCCVCYADGSQGTMARFGR